MRRSRGYSLPVRFAALTHDLGKATTPADVLRRVGHEGRSVDLLKPLCERLRVPNECRDLALVVAREHGNLHRVMEMGAAALVRLFERSDALRKPARFAEMLQACESDARGRLGRRAAVSAGRAAARRARRRVASMPAHRARHRQRYEKIRTPCIAHGSRPSRTRSRSANRGGE